MQYRTEIKRTLDEKLIHEWKKLWEKAENANIYNSYEWFISCLDAKLLTDYELHVCYKDDKLVTILPMEKYSCYGVNTVGTIGKEHLVDTSFLMESYDKELFKYFFGNLFKKRNVYLQRIDNKAAELLHKLFPHMLYSLISVNPIIDLTSDPTVNASSSTIYQIKKTLRKNEGKLRFAMYRDELEKHFETMLQLQECSSKRARSLDIFMNEKTKNYYYSLVKNCAKFIRINMVYYEDTPIVYEFGFVSKDVYIGAQISYHKDYGKLAPGKLMLYYLFENLKKENVKTLDMGGGISSYKMLMTKDYRILYNVYTSNNIAILTWWKLVNKLRRLNQIISPKKNTKDHEFLFKPL